jgi:hypothetical protein
MKETYKTVDVDITVRAKARIRLAEGETMADFKERNADIYLHGAGEEGYIEKTDLGGDIIEMNVGSFTVVEQA